MCQFMIFQILWSATRQGNVRNPKKSVLQAFTISFGDAEEGIERLQYYEVPSENLHPHPHSRTVFEN